MKRFAILSLTFLISGCPGGNPAPHPRDTIINGEHLCFSLDKRDVLNYYTIDSGENGKTQTVMSSGYDKLMYVINYGLNNKKYVHEFFIDSTGTLTK